MSNRPIFFLLITFDVRAKKRFHFTWPIPLFLLPMLLEMADDLLEFANLITIGRYGRKNDSQYSIYTAKQLLATFQGVTEDFIWETGPLDLADIDINEEDGKFFKLKLLLR